MCTMGEESGDRVINTEGTILPQRDGVRGSFRSPDVPTPTSHEREPRLGPQLQSVFKQSPSLSSLILLPPWEARGKGLWGRRSRRGNGGRTRTSWEPGSHGPLPGLRQAQDAEDLFTNWKMNEKGTFIW